VGIALWLVGGVAAAAIARFVTAGRSRTWAAEAFAAVATALVCGIVATVLDFGGWKEPDWRAATFAFAAAAAAVGLVRLVTLSRS
jgi:hypothetical protein